MNYLAAFVLRLAVAKIVSTHGHVEPSLARIRAAASLAWAADACEASP